MAAGGRTEAGVLYDATGNVVESTISTRPQVPSSPSDETDWSTKAPMNTARSQFAAVAGEDGMIYVFAGYTTIGSTADLNSTERYNPATDTWESLEPNPFVTRGSSYARGPNGKIYVISGWVSGPTTTNQIYDPDTNTWSAGAPIPTSRWEAAATRGPDGRIYFFGGETTNQLQIYDTVGDSWTTGTPMPSSRKEHKAILANDGLIYVIGGSESASVDVYDPSNDTWPDHTIPPMPARRNQFGAALGGDGKIYVIGGKTSGVNDIGPFFNEVSIFDPVANTWTVGTDLMPTARGELVAVESQGTIYALGGTSGSGLATNEALQVGGLVISNSPYTSSPSITVTGTAFDDSITTVTVNGQNATFDTNTRAFTLENFSLVTGANTVTAEGRNAQGEVVSTFTLTITLDQTNPTIVFGPEAIGVLHNRATIVFDTDEDTRGYVQYGFTPDLGEVIPVGPPVQEKPTVALVDTSMSPSSDGITDDEHDIILTDLPADTVIYYLIFAVDRTGNSSGFSEVKSFRTKRGPDTTQPSFVEFPVAEAITDSMATISFVTDELARAEIDVYRDDFGIFLFSVDTTEEDFEHRLKLTGLAPGTVYRIQVKITDVSGNTRSSGFTTFRTRSAPDTDAPRVRSIQVDPKSRATFTVITSEPAKVTIYLMQVGTEPVAKRLEDDEYIIVRSEAFRRVSQLTEGGFIEGATYQFHVEAEDQSGNVGVSRPRTFKVRAPDTTPPIILYSVILQNGGDYAVLGIGTDERTIARVDYAPTNDPTDISTVFNTVARNSHIIIITNLQLSTGYQFTFTVTDQSNNSTSSNPSVSARAIAEMSENKTLFKVLQGPGQTGRFTTNQSPDTQAPVILNGPTIVAQSSDALTVQWETDELSSSIVEYGESNFNQTESLSDNVTTHTVTLNGLSSSTTYQYRISSQDPTGNGPTLGPAPLNVAAATTTLDADISPPQISNTAVVSVTNDRAIVTFNTDEPGEGFVDFDTDMSTFGQSLGAPTLKTSHSVTLTNLAPGTTYYYRARSTDGNGNGPGFGSTESFTTALVADTADPVVSNLAVRAGYRFGIITWDTNEISNSFVQLVNGSGDTLSVASLELKTSHSVTIADTTFLPGSATQYTVIAGSTDPSGNSGESSIQFTTLAEADNTAPAIPSALAATAGNSAVSLTWTANTDTDFGGYLVFRVKGTDTTQVATGVTDANYLDESAKNDSSYSYYLKSVDTAIPTPNISEASAAVDVTPASGAEPTAPSASSPVTNATVSLKPFLLVNDATPGTSGGTLAYTFAVYSDSALTQLVASISGIPQGTPGNPTHWQVIDPAISDSVVLSSDVKYWWRARANNGTFDGAWSPAETFTASDQVPLAVAELADANVPKSHALSQNFPNPFNPSTRIQFALPKPGLVSITIYNVLGQEVRRLVNDQSYTTGFHYVTWDGRNGANQTTSSGVYLYRLEVKDGASQERVYQQAKKMLLIK